MHGAKIHLAVFVLLGWHLLSVQSEVCSVVSNFADKISKEYTIYSDVYRCWRIPVPLNAFVQIKVTRLSPQDCSSSTLKVSVEDTGEQYTFCESSDNSVTALSDVNVTYTQKYQPIIYQYVSEISRFTLEYVIKDIECVRKNSFHCNNSSCISRNKVCDGVKDCPNGADEKKCETGILSIEGSEGARNSSAFWLINESWRWNGDTPRAVMALYLAGAAKFNGADLKEELMAKQTELKIAVALLRPSTTNSELSMFVNALLVTCHNPRHFYGNNLVKRLKNQVEGSENFTHPVAYLALCNANESWPIKATTDLMNILKSDTEYPFIEDLQAMALMAISCRVNHSKSFSYFKDSNVSEIYQDTIRQFKLLQQNDGSFGNVYTTALITQALISSGQEHTRDWKLKAAAEYLMKKLNSSSVDILSTYLSLPILNAKSLTDIATVNCSANPRKYGNDLVSEINDDVGPKMRIQYSLYIGDERDVIHTISLRVPENYTAFDVMELAGVEDPKYKFDWQRMSEKMYVYQIAKITIDPEAGKFWLLFVRSANSTVPPEHFTASPDEVVMYDGEHLIMWYKTAHI